MRCVAAAGMSLFAAAPSSMACEPAVKPSGARLFARRWNQPAEPKSPGSGWVAPEQSWDISEFVVLISGTMVFNCYPFHSSLATDLAF